MILISMSFALGLYMAPEVFKDEIIDRSVDAFSFGLIIYEVSWVRLGGNL